MIESLIHCLHVYYGISATMLTLLPLGADMDASVYKAETLNNQSYFLKLRRGHHYDLTATILAFLHGSGVQQIIPPIKTIRGELVQSIKDSILTVYPFVKGQNGFSKHLTEDQWLVLGKVLRQVHSLEVPSSIKDLIKKETFSGKWRDIVRSLYTHINNPLNGDEVALKFQAFIKKHKKLLYHLVDRAEALSKKIQEQPSEFVFCHSDIHGGNVLIDESSSIYIVDWDDAVMAPKERDLMFIGGGVANTWNNSDEEAYFYQGYGKIEIDRFILAYYRYERIVQDIAEYAQALFLTTEHNEDQLELYNQFIDMFEPNGVVEIALKTDKELFSN